MTRSLLAVEEGDDMGMVKLFEDVYLAVQVLFELLVELV